MADDTHLNPGTYIYCTPSNLRLQGDECKLDRLNHPGKIWVM